MTARFDRRFFLLLVLPIAAALVLGGTFRLAYADLSKPVIKSFKGKILVSRGPLEAEATDKQTIAKFKKEHMSEVKGQANAEDSWEWAFNYTAFLKAPGATSLNLEFYSGTKYVANKQLTGVDPKLTVLMGDIVISEDDGLAKGKTYTLKLVGKLKGKEVTFATTNLAMR